jgi:hypothetical protein
MTQPSTVESLSLSLHSSSLVRSTRVSFALQQTPLHTCRKVASHIFCFRLLDRVRCFPSIIEHPLPYRLAILSAPACFVVSVIFVCK